ncbi:MULTISPECIES: hypothetical protein [Serratia]|uniref:hypothetical protein n=1 Tax=Serratia TaxID=613 RepID=UPI0024AFA9EC|nr:hypothetical protein [Serratia sp. Se-RSBMAAmG]MDI6931962.1 hypothetical protein [Serratia sp. Se-PFBMAAmG]MDI6974815.1 hypothetical protein [Serratia sp. Se-RSBMAAmG]MDI9227247.1 hypothetical protein [Serratia bockelmannii]MDI9264740.1 hypothetical protein [Serratia sp. PF2-63]
MYQALRRRPILQAEETLDRVDIQQLPIGADMKNAFAPAEQRLHGRPLRLHVHDYP